MLSYSMKWTRAFAFAFLCQSLALFSQVPERISLPEIHSVMDSVFKEHVTQKSMNNELMIKAISQFVDQFDPSRSYLLSREVDVYLRLPVEKVTQLTESYNRQEYHFFSEMNQLMQKAIMRARKIRQEAPLKDIGEVEAWASQPDSPAFAKTEQELVARSRMRIARMIMQAKQENGQDKGAISFSDLMQRVEAVIKESENEYLYQDKQGRALPIDEQNSLLALHILKAFTTSLDAHSSFLNPQEAYELKMRLQKSLDGIGVIVEDLGHTFVVSKIIQGSSAETSKQVQVGDELVTIDGSAVANMELENVMELLQGKAGTFVRLCLKRKGMPKEKMIEVNLQRQKLILNEGRVDVSYETVQNGIVGKIVLHSFYDGNEEVSSEQDMRRAIGELKKKGNLLGVVLDLRDNRGGFLMQAVKVAGLFITSGVVVMSKSNSGDIHYFRDVDPEQLYAGPLVILTSKLTASAAEIVAQALKDYGRAIIAGDEQTYGKGSIQMQTVTGKSSDPSFKVTIGTYYSVSGTSIQMTGVRADVVVPSVFYHKKMGEAYLHFPLQHDSVSSAFNDTLVDVEPEVKDWYLKYYAPYLQKAQQNYRQWIPQLQKKSTQRLAKNSEYQTFLQGGMPQHMNMERLQSDIWNFQMKEAVNIVEDLAQLSRGS